MRWGLVPYWWSKPLKQGPATFNARSDTVATKPMFRDSFKRRRCAIPMSGFYEWRQMEDGKQPFFISGKESPVLSVAGLWDNWKNRETGEAIRSCTMIVTDANPFMSEIHDRMPVFLPPERLEPWLTGNAGAEMLEPASAGFLQAWPVSRRVNSSKAPKDDTTLLDAVQPA
jgi:putative SOS response-associated peptidase YedK